MKLMNIIMWFYFDCNFFHIYLYLHIVLEIFSKTIKLCNLPNLSWCSFRTRCVLVYFFYIIPWFHVSLFAALTFKGSFIFYFNFFFILASRLLLPACLPRPSQPTDHLTQAELPFVVSTHPPKRKINQSNSSRSSRSSCSNRSSNTHTETESSSKQSIQQHQ